MNNELGFYPIINTDKYGFHNPKGVYTISKIDIALIGDSFSEGYSVRSENNIAEYNSKTVLCICDELGLGREKLFWSSKLTHEGDSNELLVSLTKAVGGDTYMCGGGADGYQDDAVFASAGIELKRQNFKHPEYPQHNAPAFQAGLSIIDAVANIGWAQTAKLLGSSG